MAKTTSKETDDFVENNCTVSGINSELPKNIDINEITIAANIKNCAFIATEVLINANIVKKTKAIVPVILKSFIVIPYPK